MNLNLMNNQKTRSGYMNLNLMNNQVKVMQRLGTDCSTIAHVVPLCAHMTITTTARNPGFCATNHSSTKVTLTSCDGKRLEKYFGNLLRSCTTLYWQQRLPFGASKPPALRLG
jgi:hypothetical protein